uniref:Uncharacterized protein n=1 Tax=Tabanus bromius TaxID=304241 RepID=A0A0K8TNV4_TABBR
MSLLNFIKRNKNFTVSFMTKGMLATVGVIVSYKFIIEPALNRRRRRQAEAYADFIFEKERQDTVDE